MDQELEKDLTLNTSKTNSPVGKRDLTVSEMEKLSPAFAKNLKQGKEFLLKIAPTLTKNDAARLLNHVFGSATEEEHLKRLLTPENVAKLIQEGAEKPSGAKSIANLSMIQSTKEFGTVSKLVGELRAPASRASIELETFLVLGNDPVKIKDRAKSFTSAIHLYDTEEEQLKATQSGFEGFHIDRGALGTGIDIAHRVGDLFSGAEDSEEMLSGELNIDDIQKATAIPTVKPVSLVSLMEFLMTRRDLETESGEKIELPPGVRRIEYFDAVYRAKASLESLNLPINELSDVKALGKTPEQIKSTVEFLSEPHIADAIKLLGGLSFISQRYEDAGTFTSPTRGFTAEFGPLVVPKMAEELDRFLVKFDYPLTRQGVPESLARKLPDLNPDALASFTDDIGMKELVTRFKKYSQNSSLTETHETLVSLLMNISPHLGTRSLKEVLSLDDADLFDSPAKWVERFKLQR